MSLKIENLSGLDRKVVINLKLEDFNNEIKKKLLEKQKNLKISGFRPGKVPLKMVDGMYGKSLRDNLLNELASKEFYNFIMENKINFAGLQKFDFDDNKSDDKQLKIQAFFDVYPDDIKIVNFDELEFEKILSRIEDDDINNTIEMLRKQKAKFELATDNEAKIDDRVTIDFEGFIDNLSLNGSKANDYIVILGSNQLIPELEKGIIGMKLFDIKDIEVNFPDDYNNKDLAGKKVIFKIKLKKLENIKLPDLDELFIKSLGIEDGKLETLSKEISKNLNREVTFRSYSLTKKKVLDKLLESTTNISIPKSLLDSEIKKLKDLALKDLKKQGLSDDKLNNFSDDLFKERAKNNISLGLILNKIIEDNKLTVDDKKIREVVSVFAENYEDPQSYMDWYLKNNLEEAKALALENSVIDLILSKSKIKEKNYSFREIMKLN